METRLLPIFPLHLVLFPGMVLPLRIFEPRYRLMVKRCLEGDRRFGVALIQEGEEVGDRATPSEMGTMAEISGYEVMPDGQIMLVCVGLRRFRITREVAGEPYVQAEVEVIEEGDPAAPMPGTLREDAQRSLEAYYEAVAAISSSPVPLPDEPLSAIDLSYLIAASLQVDNDDKQALLEAPDTAARLAKGLELLEEENAAMHRFLAESDKHGDFFFRGNRMSRN